MACNGQRKLSNQQFLNSDDRFTLVTQNNYSGVDTTELLVIKDVKNLKWFYSQINKTRKPGLPVPQVDFEKDMLLVLCSNEDFTNIAYGLTLAEETSSTMVFSPKTVPLKQEKSKTVPQEYYSHPFYVYKMRLTDKDISFKNVK